jgi:hypothetical protein
VPPGQLLRELRAEEHRRCVFGGASGAISRENAEHFAMYADKKFLIFVVIILAKFGANRYGSFKTAMAEVISAEEVCYRLAHFRLKANDARTQTKRPRVERAYLKKTYQCALLKSRRKRSLFHPP